MLNIFLELLAIFSALCVAIPVHEWAHAYIAHKQGDDTAKVMGRMTLAPFAHFDVWGFLCMFFLGFGWAKPVPVDVRNLKHGKKSNFLVSIAGILANLVTGTFFIMISCALNTFFPNYITVLGFYGYALNIFLDTVISLNFVLAFFNILPIYPLDGFRIVETYAKPNSGYVNFMRRYSNVILILLVLFSGILTIYFNHTAGYLKELITSLFNSLFGLFI